MRPLRPVISCLSPSPRGSLGTAALAKAQDHPHRPWLAARIRRTAGSPTMLRTRPLAKPSASEARPFAAGRRCHPRDRGHTGFVMRRRDAQAGRLEPECPSPGRVSAGPCKPRRHEAGRDR